MHFATSKSVARLAFERTESAIRLRSELSRLNRSSNSRDIRPPGRGGEEAGGRRMEMG